MHRRVKKSYDSPRSVILDFQSGSSIAKPSYEATKCTDTSKPEYISSPSSGYNTFTNMICQPTTFQQHRYISATGSSSKKRSRRHTVQPDCHITSSIHKAKQVASEHLRTQQGEAATRSTHGSIEGSSSFYIDLGDCKNFCEHCGSTYWYEERLKGHDQAGGLKYNKCCVGGKIKLPTSRDPPEDIKALFEDRSFIDNIRAYNQMFSMTSFGAKIDDTVNNGHGPYVFKVSGQIYHWIGSMCPPDGDPPRFLQLYIYDTGNEVSNRLRFYGGKDGGPLKTVIVQHLIDFLDANNELVKIFMYARDKCEDACIPDFKIRLYNAGGARGYELPTSDTLGGIVFENGPASTSDYDVIIELKGGHPQRVDKLHPSYMSLQFPLLFLYGQPGFHTKLQMKTSNTSQTQRRLSMNMFYTYQLHTRSNQYDLLFRAGRLFQQYVVNIYCSIEQNRMDYIRANQNDIRNDHLLGIYDALSKGDLEGSAVGTRVILPSSFTGGPRYMYSHYLDALAICRELGNPQFFYHFYM